MTLTLDPPAAPEEEPLSRPRDRRRRRFSPTKWLPVPLALLGVLVLLYPVLATQHNNQEQQRIADAYSATVESAGPDAVAEQLRSAERYNDELQVLPILDPWLEYQRPDSPEYIAYESELDLNPVMSQLVIPEIAANLPIYHGTDDATLEKGAGHLFGTNLPIGGASTHAVITAHSGLASATLFDRLPELEVGAEIYLSTLGQRLKYEVTDIRVVLPNETESLRKVAGRDLITLITCTPYGVNTHRLLVTAERVPLDPVAADEAFAADDPLALRPWMVAVLVVVAVVVLVLVGVLIGTILRRRRRHARGAHAAEADDAAAEPTRDADADADAGTEAATETEADPTAAADAPAPPPAS